MGEDEVCQYLMQHGHTILERNWRSGHLEIDIISMAGDGIHFVEVKSRTAPVRVAGEESVRRPKQRKIITGAGKFLAANDGHLQGDFEVFFDVAAVTFAGGGCSVEYFPEAYMPEYY